MKELVKVFSNSNIGDVEIRIDNNGSFEIEASAVAKGLGWTYIKDEKEYVRWNTVNEYLTEFGFSQQVAKENFIPESYFYLLAMKANNETAIAFQKWIAFEVLPQIRQTGGYIPIKEEDTEGEIMAKALLIAQKTITSKDQIIINQQKRLEEQQPKVKFHDDFIASDKESTLTEAANLLGFKKLGVRKMCQLLHEKNIFYKCSDNDNMPMRAYEERGYFTIKEVKAYVNYYGETVYKLQTYVLPNGLKWLNKKLKENGYEKIA